MIDLHQDIQLHRKRPETYPEGFRNQTSFSQLEAADISVVFGSGFAAPVSGDFFDPEAVDLLTEDLGLYRKHVAEANRWEMVTSGSDLQAVVDAENKHGIIFHIEALNTFTGNEQEWNRLEAWHENGWRSVGIVWNKTNKLGGGTHDRETGLTDLGYEVLSWAQHRNMVVDLAHMNPPTFSAALEATSGPVILSHGNARHVTDTDRNYSDEQLVEVAKRGGVVGVFFSASNVASSDPDVSDVVEHIEHMQSLIGIDHIALGTDFGGLTGEPVSGLESVTNLVNLRKALRNAGFNRTEIEKIWQDNARRVLEDVLP
ncbi:MAG: hypothetical protein BRC25_01820 [Parcubacteria group bacterium SW_6_46_9]|nr:MAG: hypothetical protein BRC25_01820 [Parcubacteria group bacterium SW_6_46_9]